MKNIKLIILLLIVMTFSLFVGCGANKEKEFSYEKVSASVKNGNNILGEKVKVEGVAYVIDNISDKTVYLIEMWENSSIPYNELTKGDILAMYSLEDVIGGFVINSSDANSLKAFDEIQTGNIVNVQGILTGEEDMDGSVLPYFNIKPEKISIKIKEEKFSDSINAKYKSRVEELENKKKEKEKLETEENEAKAEKELRETIQKNIDKIKTLIVDKKYDEGVELINATLTLNVNDKESSELAKLQQDINVAKSSKVDGAQNNNSNSNNSSNGKKQQYLNMLEEINKKSLELKPLYDSGVTSKMIEAANVEYTFWDDALNDIWAVLKADMNESDFDILLDRQLSWLTIRDELAAEAESQGAGGTMGPLLKVDSLKESTKNRCYELVKNYMK